MNLSTFVRDESNVSLNAPMHIAEAFNEHFSDIGDKLAAKIQEKTSFKSFLIGRNPNSMEFFCQRLLKFTTQFIL